MGKHIGLIIFSERRPIDLSHNFDIVIFETNLEIEKKTQPKKIFMTNRRTSRH